MSSGSGLQSFIDISIIEGECRNENLIRCLPLRSR